MKTYFKPLRRKLGVVTLALACVVMAGRLRSSAVQDTLTIGSASSFQVKVISTSNRLILAKVLAEGDEYPLADFWLSQETTKGYWDLILRFSDWSCPKIGLALTSDLYSFGTSAMNSDTARCVVTWCQFPHSLVGIPLTLVATWLLLSQPPARQKAVPNVEM